ncbi:RIIa domain-containing protein 1 [Thoreauomyces humboldtii]|nr:RIIa domain-containing protein 1 [Thoreauomyces humboldtii]
MNTSAPPARPESARIIDAAMQQKLNIDRIQIRVENELYLREHPEIRQILDFFVNEVLVQQPEDLQEFAAGLFSDPNLRPKVEKHTSESREFENGNQELDRL